MHYHIAPQRLIQLHFICARALLTPPSLFQNPAREREEFFKIQQERESEEFFKNQQERSARVERATLSKRSTEHVYIHTHREYGRRRLSKGGMKTSQT